MKCFASWFTKKLIQCGIIKADEQALYAYGFWQGMFTHLILTTVVIVGLLSSMLWQSLLFTIAYGVLRSMSGGYHARTQQICYLFSILLLLAALAMLTWFPWSTLWSVIISSASTLVVFLLAPVADENKPLDETETMVYRKRSRYISLILAIFYSLGFGLSYFCKNRYIIMIIPFLIYLVVTMLASIVNIAMLSPVSLVVPHDIPSISWGEMMAKYGMAVFFSACVVLYAYFKSCQEV